MPRVFAREDLYHGPYAEAAPDLVVHFTPGYDPKGALGGLNSFYLLVDEPEVYGLPRKPQLPSRNLAKSAGFSVASAAVLGVLALVGLRKRRMDDMGGPGAGGSN